MVKRPNSVWLVLLGLAALPGCRQAEPEQTIHPAIDGTQLAYASLDSRPANLSSRFISDILPEDEASKAGGAKVRTKSRTALLRSPRSDSPAYYFVDAGTPLSVNLQPDRNWLKVRLSRGRSVFVKRDQTDANLALLIAQGSVPDSKRLTPSPKTDLEPDSGNRRGGSPASKDEKLSSAIDDATESLQILASSFETLRSDAIGFQGTQDTWPQTKTSVSLALSTNESDERSFASDMATISGDSSAMSANQKSAFQSLSIAQGDLSSALSDIRTALNQMIPGEDWTEAISDLQAALAQAAVAMDNIARQLSRL
jgi:hypothetical protein